MKLTFAKRVFLVMNFLLIIGCGSTHHNYHHIIYQKEKREPFSITAVPGSQEMFLGKDKEELGYSEYDKFGKVYDIWGDYSFFIESFHVTPELHSNAIGSAVGYISSPFLVTGFYTYPFKDEMFVSGGLGGGNRFYYSPEYGVDLTAAFSSGLALGYTLFESAHIDFEESFVSHQLSISLNNFNMGGHTASIFFNFEFIEEFNVGTWAMGYRYYN
jgi:hypothetical protein